MNAFNFAQCLLERMSPASHIADAATGQRIESNYIRSWVARMAAYLQHLGLVPGDRVVIGCALSPDSALMYLAVMYAGMIAVPVEQKTLKSESLSVLKSCEATAVWANEIEIPSSLPTLKIAMDDVEGMPEVDAMPCSKDDIGVLMATSGSTEQPRFVMVSHGNLLTNTEAIVRSQRLATGERAMLILPINYCFGASVLHSHLYTGGSVVFDRRFMFPDKVLNAIGEYGCTSFAGVPTIYRILINRSHIGTIAMPTLRRFLQAGGRLDAHTIKRIQAVVPNVDFVVMYGQTEATARITTLDPVMLSEKLGSVGKPLDNLDIRLVNERGEEVPVGATGEVRVKGPSVTRGYWNDPERTREVFVDDWLHTGDLAHFDEDGFLWINGRNSDFIKVRGIRVSLTEAEDRISKIDGVEEVGACAVTHEEAGEALALSIVLSPEVPFEAIRPAVLNTLPVSWTCPIIRAVSQLPRTSNGKLSRVALAEQIRDLYEQHPA